VQSIAVKCLGILFKKGTFPPFFPLSLLFKLCHSRSCDMLLIHPSLPPSLPPISLVHEAQVTEICDKLCGLILEGKPELRDIYSIGLKTLISDVPDTMGKVCCLSFPSSFPPSFLLFSCVSLTFLPPSLPPFPQAVATRLSSRLLGGVQQEQTLEVKLECLDNLTDLLKRFGHDMEGDHSAMMTSGLQQLQHTKPTVRKRANAFLGALAVVVSDPLLNQLMEELLRQIAAAEAKGPKEVQTLIQTVGTVSRTVGHRLGKHLPKIVPLFLKFLGDPTPKDEEEDEDGREEEGQDDEKNELRETIFAAFESVVLRCPREVTSHLPLIVSVALGFMKWDPNYTYEEEEESGGGEEGGGMEVEDEEGGGEGYEDEEEEDYGGSDDDDTSWKVRRAALKVLGAIITSRPEMLERLYDQCADELIGRFKEREENVRLDVIACFTCLLKATLALEGSSGGGGKGGRGGGAGGGVSVVRGESSGGAMMVVDGAGGKGGREGGMAHALLASRVEAIVRAADKQLRKSDTSSSSSSSSSSMTKTKSAVLAMLRSLTTVLHGGLENHLRTLINDLKRCLADKAQGLKLDAISLLHTVFETHPPRALHPFLPEVVPLVTACAEDEWYKLIAQALRVLGVLIAILRPFPKEGGKEEGIDVDLAASYVPALYEAIFPRLDAHDIDQEIKEGAILAMGKLVSHLGDRLVDGQLDQILSLLMEKLKNEITRTPTLKALAAIATSPLQIDLSPILEGAVEELALFLRQQSRPLKLATLETLIALVKSNAASMTPPLFELILTEAASLISDADLHLSHLALLLTVHVLQASPQSAGLIVQQHSLPKVLRLAASPLLQGYALRSLLSLLDELVHIHAKAKGLDPPSLIASFEDIALHYPSSHGHGHGHHHTSSTGSNSSSSSSSSSATTAAPKQVIHNLAVCMARIAAHPSTPPSDLSSFTARLVTNMRSTLDAPRHLALLAMGELGAQRDLSSSVANVQSIILESFEVGGNEEIKTAAAHALGHVTAGNPHAYLPVVLERLATHPVPGAEAGGGGGGGGGATKAGGRKTKASAAAAAKAEKAVAEEKEKEKEKEKEGQPKPQQYLLLLSLKEVILTHTARGKDFSAHVGEVLPYLFQHTQCPEEGVRNMVAECLGALANIDPKTVFAALGEHAKEGGKEGGGADQHTRWTIVTALKFSLSSSGRATGGLGGGSAGGRAAAYLATEEEGKALLKETMGHALSIQVDEKTGTTEDLDVVRATLLLVNAAAHHQPRVLLPFLQSHAVPLLFKSLELKLLRKVNLGPFTHTVDDGLPLRKASFACIDTLLDSLPSVLEMSSFMPYLAKGLEDKDDVQLLAHQILGKVARSSPASLLASLETLLPPLEAVANKQMKDTSVGTEVERAQDLIRSAVRAMVAVSKEPREGGREGEGLVFFALMLYSQKNNQLIILSLPPSLRRWTAPRPTPSSIRCRSA